MYYQYPQSLQFASTGVAAGIVADYRLMPEVVRPVQTHSCHVAVIPSDGDIPCLDDTDAIICLRPGLKIGVRTADCVPVVVYAPDICAVAAIHAGWKGSLGGIVGNALRMLEDMGADLSRAEAAFGPSICGACYEVSEEFAGQFADAGYADCIVSHRHLDLEAVNRKQLLRAGLRQDRIHPKPCCTRETSALPSWRRMATADRLLTWIYLSI